MLAAVLSLLNTYPLIISRDLIFDAKEDFMKNQVSNISASLETLDELSENGVYYVLSMLNTEKLSTVVVSDRNGSVIYAITNGGGQQDSATIQTRINQALSGKDVFRSEFQSGAFSSCAASPINSEDGSVIGAVYIDEYDSNQGSILVDLQNNLKTLSVVISVLAVFLSIFFSETITRRITGVLNAIKLVREGDYNYQVKVKGNDELTQLENEFNSLTNRLQVTEEARRRFVSDASHELKTPLASIKLLSDSILQNSNMDTDTMLEFVNDIQGEAERLTRTTEKLLNLTRIDNRVAPKRTPVDMKKAAEDVMGIIRPIADEQGIALHGDFQEGCFVFASEDDIDRVMINLCENAVKYNMPHGNVYLTVRREGDAVLFVTEDTGIGIPDADLPHIFDRFYRVDVARSREAGGSGLGLSIVFATVTEYGGSIEAKRRDEGGMRFTVTLPAMAQDGTTPSENAGEQQLKKDEPHERLF